MQLLTGQPICHNAVDQRAERHADMGGGHFTIHFRIARHADTPIQNAIRFCIDCRLPDGFGECPLKGLQKIAGASGRVTSWQYTFTVPFENLSPHQIRGPHHRSVGRKTLDWRTQRDYRSNALRHLRGSRARQGTTKAVAN